MKDYLKYIVILIVTAAVLTIFFQIKSWFEPSHERTTLTTPIDPNFTPIEEKKYRPPSTPFERPPKPPVVLPKGVREKDVDRIITVYKKIPVARGDSLVVDTTNVVLTKTGEVFVPKQSGKEVTVQQVGYVAPIFSFGWFSSFGVAVARPGNPISFSPTIAATPLEIVGTVQLPLIMIDLQGIGAGVGVRYADFVFTPVCHLRFGDAERQLKFVILYSIN